MTLHVCKHSNLLCSVIFVNLYNFSTMTSLCCQLSAQEIVNWVTNADGCVHTADVMQLDSFVSSAVCIGHKVGQLGPKVGGHLALHVTFIK